MDRDQTAPEELRLLADLLDIVGAAAMDLEALLSGFLRKIIQSTGAERGMILQPDPEAGLAVRVAFDEADREIRQAHCISLSLPREAMEKRTGLRRIWGPEQEDDQCATPSMRAYDLRSVLCVPLETRQEVVGVLYLDSPVALRRFSDEDLRRLKVLCDHLALHIENARLLEERRQQEAARRAALEREVSGLRQRLGEREHLVGESQAMRCLLDQVEQVAPTDATVLLLGETGTGKESIAQHLHRRSPRASRPFVVVDPGSVPDTLLESELFGHERGAFTGADKRRIGKFEQAEGGTIFLDEIGDLPMPLQAKFLRVLEERSIQRLGGSRIVPVNIRVVAATNRDLAAMVEEGSFRSDLYYRLNVVRMELPPLRDRGEDRQILATHFLEGFTGQYGKEGLRLSRAARAALGSHRWPGNVRELKHRIQRAVILARASEVSPTDLDLSASTAGFQEDPWLELADLLEDRVRRASRGEQVRSLWTSLMEPLEVWMSRTALERAQGNRAQAARLLGIERRRLTRRLDSTAPSGPDGSIEPEPIQSLLDRILRDRTTDAPAGSAPEDLFQGIQDQLVQSAHQVVGPNRRRLQEILGLAPATLRKRLGRLNLA